MTVNQVTAGAFLLPSSINLLSSHSDPTVLQHLSSIQKNEALPPSYPLHLQRISTGAGPRVPACLKRNWGIALLGKSRLHFPTHSTFPSNNSRTLTLKNSSSVHMRGIEVERKSSSEFQRTMHSVNLTIFFRHSHSLSSNVTGRPSRWHSNAIRLLCESQ